MTGSNMKEARAEERIQLVRPVYFDGTDSSRYAFSTNLSLSGICIITNRDISEGETVRLYSKFLWDDPRQAKAVWTKAVSSTVIKVGLRLSTNSMTH
jgi:hypothetical protein